MNRLMILTLAFLSIPSPVLAYSAPGTTIEVTANNAFIPPHGFDDNDTIEFVLDGKLPNACWVLGQSQVERGPGGGLKVRQMAYRSPMKMCTSGDNLLPAAWKAPVQYMKEVKIGTLRAGDYSITYRSGWGTLMHREFSVSAAQLTTQDDFPYANVSNAYVPEEVPAESPITVTLTGLLTGGCTQLDGEPTVLPMGDVIVVLPKLKLDAGGCAGPDRSFEAQVALGTLRPGRYLLHVRSTNGGAVNRVFTVR